MGHRRKKMTTEKNGWRESDFFNLSETSFESNVIWISEGRKCDWFGAFFIFLENFYI